MIQVEEPYRGGEFLVHRLLDVHGSEAATPSLSLSIANLVGRVIDPNRPKSAWLDRPLNRGPRVAAVERTVVLGNAIVPATNPAGLPRSAGQPAFGDPGWCPATAAKPSLT